MNLVRLEEAPGGLFGDLLGEVDDEDVAEEAQEDGQDTFQDEDPAPAVVARDAGLSVSLVAEDGIGDDELSHHLLDAERQHAGEAVAERADEIEARVALLHVIAGVVRREEVDTSYKSLSVTGISFTPRRGYLTWKVAGLEEAKNETERD